MLNLSPEKAVEVLDSFKKYDLITTSDVELDDEMVTIYSFNPNPAFVPLLAFANEMIDSYNNKRFYYYHGSRHTPYLKK